METVCFKGTGPPQGTRTRGPWGTASSATASLARTGTKTCPVPCMARASMITSTAWDALGERARTPSRWTQQTPHEVHHGTPHHARRGTHATMELRRHLRCSSHGLAETLRARGIDHIFVTRSPCVKPEHGRLLRVVPKRTKAMTETHLRDALRGAARERVGS